MYIKVWTLFYCSRFIYCFIF